MTEALRTKLLGPFLTTLVASGCASVEATASIDIDRPVEEAWAVFADEELLDEWFRGMPWIGDEVTVGEVRTWETREGGEDVKVFLQTVTALEENERFAFDLDHDWFHMEHLFRFEPRGADACTLHLTTTTYPSMSG